MELDAIWHRHSDALSTIVLTRVLCLPTGRRRLEPTVKVALQLAAKRHRVSTDAVQCQVTCCYDSVEDSKIVCAQPDAWPAVSKHGNKLLFDCRCKASLVAVRFSLLWLIVTVCLSVFMLNCNVNNLAAVCLSVLVLCSSVLDEWSNCTRVCYDYYYNYYYYYYY